MLEYARVPLRKSAPVRSRYFIAGFFLGLLLLPFVDPMLVALRSRFRFPGSS